MPLLIALAAAVALAPGRWAPARPQYHRSRPAVSMSEELPYDLARLTWDLLENRKFRRETLLQYAVTSRVDQLRLLFFASSSVVAAVFPWFARELVPDLVSDVGISSAVLSAAASAAFAALALGEKSNRGKKLVRLERELALGELSVWQPDSPIGARSKPQLLASLRGKRRLIACCAAPSRLLTVARAAAVYRRRFEQSGVVLVLVNGQTIECCKVLFTDVAY